MPISFLLRFRTPLGVAALLLLPAVCSAANDPVDLTARAAVNEPYTVSLELELGGEAKGNTSEQESSKQPAAEPVQVAAKFAYDELLLPGSRQAVRYYNTIDAQLTLGGEISNPTLRPSRKLIVAQTTEQGTVQLAAVDGPLRRNELDVIEIAGDSLALQRLLPGEEKQIGDSWKHDDSAMQLVLGMQQVSLCEVSSALMESNKGFARCELAGVVHGTRNGAETQVELRGVYLFDRGQGRITKMNLALREKRSVGPATRGLDTTAKLRIQLTPAEKTHSLTPARVAQAKQVDFTGQSLLETSDNRLGFQTRHDTSWFQLGRRGEELAIRRVGQNGLVAHANLTKLPAKTIDTDKSLAKFRADFVASLGNSATGVVSDEQWINEHGCRVMTVVVEGEVAGTAMQWRGYQVAPPVDAEQLHRLALTVAVEESHLEELGKTDRELVDRMVLLGESTREARKAKSVR